MGAMRSRRNWEIAYNYYKDSEPALAFVAIDRFTKQNPMHPSMDYALYLRGLIAFNEAQGFMSQLVRQDMSERDPEMPKSRLSPIRSWSSVFLIVNMHRMQGYAWAI